VNYFSKNAIGEIIALGGSGIFADTTISRLADLIPYISAVEDIRVKVKENQRFDLPKTVQAKTNKGTLAYVPVDWNLTNVSTSKAGTYYFTGNVKNYGGTVHLELIVEPGPVKVDTLRAEVIQGAFYTLPDKVIVTMSDNTTEEMSVTWSTTPNVSILNKIGTYTFRGTVDGTTLTTTLSLKVSQDKAIEFKDRNLEWAVRFMIGKNASTQPIYLSEVLQLTHLNANGYGIKDLTGLESFSNLTSLDLGNNFLETRALNTIQRLSNLEYLNLRNNNLEQITPLRNMTTLTYLNLSLNQIKDFSPIRNLIRLKSLYLMSNETQDFSPARLYYHQLIDKDFTL
ncbi:MAG: hypothetical protein GX958_05580, partial [Desulfitobacterium sp.]|nr:hypothetical protein [Desulfitobacterium sp.]